jgi:DNA mismatch repair protein MutL
MTCRIKTLPDNLINKIAAGEVVERPASVVKELIENSIDAEATHISVEIERGGTKLVKVTDDGLGMTSEEAELAVTRHATSKISSVDDLFAISTLGFRGEALPSIASVSMFSITTRRRDSAEGARIMIDGGRTKSSGPSGSPPGTVIEVRELFFNLPARRKFLKSLTTETRQVIQVVTSLSLAHPSVGFRLDADGRSLFDYAPASSPAQRISDVYGENLSSRFLSFEKDTGQINVIAFISKPDDARRHRMEARFFVNRRPVSSRLIHAAVMSAFGELLPKGCYPQGALFVDISPDLVDVNVSPSKNEVRFKDERSVYHVIYHSVSEAVSRSDVIPEIPQDAGDAGSAEYIERARTAVESFIRSHDSGPDDRSQASLSLDTKPEVTASVEPAAVKPGSTTPPQTVTPSPSPIRPYRLVGFSDLYIVALSAEAIFIIDQHAAHERVLYEKALVSFGKSQIVAQKLLFPVNVELDAASFQAAESTLDRFEKLGFEIRPFGSRSVAIYASPAVARNANPETVFRNILDDISGFESEGEDINKKMAQSFACRAAIKSGNRLTEEEMAGLVKDLFLCGNPYVCPHGRPTLIKLNKSELEKRFGR